MGHGELLGTLAEQAYDRWYANARMIFISCMFHEMGRRDWDISAIRTRDGHILRPCMLRHNRLERIRLDIPPDGKWTLMLDHHSISDLVSVDGFIAWLHANMQLRKYICRHVAALYRAEKKKLLTHSEPSRQTSWFWEMIGRILRK
jgi:hypothetical protein